MPVVGGDCTLTINGRQLTIMPGPSVQPTGKTRVLIEAATRDGVPRWTERVVPGKLSIVCVNDAAMPFADLSDLANGSGTLEAANGITYRLSNLTRMGDPPAIDQGEGTFQLEFVGDIHEQ